MKTKINKKKGMTLLIAVVLTTTLLLISFAISRIAYKQQILTFSAKDSEVAFYAADSGTECALYHDLKAAPNFFATPVEQTTGTIECSGVAIENADVTTGGNTAITKFAYNLNNTDPKSCAIIKVTKTLIDVNGEDIILTEIESRGYNNTCDTSNQGNSTIDSGPRNLERALRVTY